MAAILKGWLRRRENRLLERVGGKRGRGGEGKRGRVGVGGGEGESGREEGKSGRGRRRSGVEGKGKKRQGKKGRGMGNGEWKREEGRGEKVSCDDF